MSEVTHYLTLPQQPPGRCLIVRRPLSRWEFLGVEGRKKKISTPNQQTPAIRKLPEGERCDLKKECLAYLCEGSKRGLVRLNAQSVAQSFFIKLQRWMRMRRMRMRRKVGAQTVARAAVSRRTQSPNLCDLRKRRTLSFGCEK